MMARDDEQTDAELELLRAELARVVLREVGATVASNPDSPLGAALQSVIDAAVREGVDMAVRTRAELDPARFAEQLFSLAQARADEADPGGWTEAASYRARLQSEPEAAGGWAGFLDACGRRPAIVILAGVLILAAAFAGGWFGRDLLVRPTQAPAASSAQPDDGQAGSDQPQAAAEPGDGAVLTNVPASGRPPAATGAARGHAARRAHP